jgi:hypothetical protein
MSAIFRFARDGESKNPDKKQLRDRFVGKSAFFCLLFFARTKKSKSRASAKALIFARQKFNAWPALMNTCIAGGCHRLKQKRTNCKS